MKILITGHRGYIGSHLFPLLDAAGCDLQDGRDFSDIRGQQFDVVIHLAAIASVMQSIHFPEKCFETNVSKLAAFIQNNRINKLVFASTGGALYGNKHRAREEDASWKGCISPYGQSKYLAEQVIQQMHSNYAILRLANVMGGDDMHRSDALAHRHFREDNPIVVYGGSQIRDFVPIDNVCQAIVRAANSAITGIFNIGSDTETRVSDVAEKFSKERNVPLLYESSRVGEVEIISLDSTQAKKVGLL